MKFVNPGTILLLGVLGGMIAGTSLAAEQSHPLPNGGFEETGPNGWPVDWQPRSIGVEANFAVDDSERQEGRRSARITATETTRSYFYSRLIPVTPGERVTVSAWVKTANVPAEKGTVILIADFLVADHAPAGGPTKVAVAARTGAWESIRGTVTAPPRANFLQVRCGFSYSQGTCWWDDVRVQFAQDLAARLSLREGQLVPENGGVAVEVLNRGRQKRSATLRLTLGSTTVSQPIVLSGDSSQRFNVKLPAIVRGRQKAALELLDEADRPLAPSGALTVLVPPVLTVAPLIPTHWVREDGPPRFEGEAWLALAETSPEARLFVRVVDANDRECAVLRQPLAATSGGVTRFQVSLPKAAEGAYRVLVSVEGAGGAGPAIEQPWRVIAREQARVTLNETGYPVVAGRVLFPLGMFNNTAKLDESAAAGFNLVHMYNAARVEAGSRPDDQRLKNELDRTERLGLRCLLLVPMEFAAAGQWDAFTRRIRMFRNHPALLAWDEEEGLARGDMKLETLARIRRILREEDLHHPFMVGDARDVITRITDRRAMFPEESMDLGMWWWYPFPLKSRTINSLEGTESSGPLLEAPIFLTEHQTTKPVWVGVQSYRKPAASERYPTPAEYRAQACLALISGAQGLMWYGGSVTGGLFLNPREGHWDDLKALVRELADLTPLLVAAPQAAPVVTPATPSIKAGWRRVAGGGVLLVVNCSPEPWRGQLTVPGLKARTLTSRALSQTFTSENGQVALNLGAYDSRILTWRENDR